MISALSWIPRGAAKQKPEKLEMSEEEYDRIAKEIGAELDLAKEGMVANEQHIMDADNDDDDDSCSQSGSSSSNEEAENGSSGERMEMVESVTEVDEMAKYNLDSYDNEETALTGIPVFGKNPGLAYYTSSGDQDPYVVLKDEEDLAQELEEMEILPTDNMLVACKTEDDVSHLEVFLWEGEEDNLYVHHDIMLPSFPLCSEWLDFRVGKKTGIEGSGNYVAIGTFEPEIEIWDLDIIDPVYPSIILGSTTTPGAKPKSTGKKKSRKNNDRHCSAVTSLSWNKSHRNLILSASADSTVKLWDLSSNDTSTAVKSYNHHTDKVTACCWNSAEPTVFLTGGYDQGGRVCALDSRVPDQVASWKLGSDVECLKWDPFHPERFLVSTEDGLVRCYDARASSSTTTSNLKQQQQPLYTIHAHDGACSALDLSPQVEGLLVTGSADKMVKVWDVRDGREKSCIVSRDLGVGKVFTASFCMDSPLVLAASGSKGKVIVWNLQNNSGVRKIFAGSAVVPADGVAEEPKEVVTVDSDHESSDEEGGEEDGGEEER